MRLAAFLSLILAVCLLVPAPAGAQLPSGGITQVGIDMQELNISLNPMYPRPYDTVGVTVESTLVDLTTSKITISVNGTVISEGERTGVFVMGGPGSRNVILVTVTNVDGTFTEEMALTPAEVTLILESSATAPPFYPGATLVASEGPVRLIALPDFRTAAGVRIPPQDLAYTWRFGNKILTDQSGIGKSSLSAIAPVRYRDARITVTVTSQDKTLVAEEETMVTPRAPIMRIYRSDPLAGIDFANALSGTFRLTGDEESFHAVPFFFSGEPELSWELNGDASETDPDLTVRTTGSSAGSAYLGVSGLKREGFIPQTADTEVRLQFDASRSRSLFNL